MRILFPIFCRLPSSIALTFNFSPISWMFFSLLLNENEEVFAGTRKSLIFVKAFNIDSANPSHKYSWSFWGLKSSNGRTAIDGLSNETGTVSFLGRSCQIITTAATRATTTRVGIKSFFNPKVTVISFEVRGFLSEATLSVVGRPFSMFVSSELTSPALWYLFSFSFSRHLIMTLLRSSGICLFSSLGSLGISLLCFTPIVNGVSPSKGTWPVTISYIITPKEYISDRWSISFPSTCSGDMYSGVPIIIPAPVIPLVLRERAIPKSMIRVFPSLSIIMLLGFRSRWTIPNLCASANPSHTCLAIVIALAVLKGAARLMKLFKSSPDTYSIVMKCAPSASPKSNIPQTFFWRIFRASFSSFLNLSIVFLSLAISGFISLRATSCFNFVSSTL